jgi:hypothetical protein
MRLKQSFLKFILTFTLSILFCVFISSVTQAQSTTTAQVAREAFFYKNSSFWEKLSVSIISAFLGTILGYFSSGKQHRDQAIELSYATSVSSVLEFKKDIGSNEEIGIRYREHHDLADLYVISCDLENTGRKVIKNNQITFELHSANIGILDQFFEPPLYDNLMGIEEVKIEDINESNIKKRYLIREILPGQKVGFRFVTARHSQQDEIPNLFVSNPDSSNTELVPKKYKGEKDEVYRIMDFVLFFILFITVPQILNPVPFFGDLLAILVRLILFAFIFLNIRAFSEIIAKLLIQPFHKNETSTAQYHIMTGDRSVISVGDNTITEVNKEDEETVEK